MNATGVSIKIINLRLKAIEEFLSKDPLFHIHLDESGYRGAFKAIDELLTSLKDTEDSEALPEIQKLILKIESGDYHE